MAKKADYCVFVGRFQPFHKAHLQIVLNALDEADKLIIVVGSYRTSMTVKNPWDFTDRKTMIMKSIPKEYHEKIQVVALRDYMYNNNHWISNLQNIVTNITGHGDATDRPKIKLIGHFKDDTSFYLEFFPQWELVEQPNFFGIDATEIRNMMYEDNDEWQNMVSPDIVQLLKYHMDNDRFKEFVREHKFLKSYKKRWESAPFKPVFVTTDAVVVKSGHVLVVKRKMNPGKGKYALPGGFIGDQPIFDSAVRELYEETKIVLPRDVLRRSLADQRVFDHPMRSLRGRTITHAYFFRLDHKGPLPQVTGADDAEEALWMPLSDLALNEENFYEDHIHIINHFVSKV